ncbi:probable Rab proteins geranylgeranyltransferase component A [Zygosaccharomyces bailii]|nr:probable Rab proteins geranylgeranyltransferase component A [Zygosaccharomyces bailii]
MMNSERRPSMAERRPQILSMTSPSTSSVVVPHLAGIEDPLPDTTPEKVDVLIVGTGMVESVLAAALSWQGSSVLHIDKNDHYGDSSATLTVDQIKKWVAQVNEGIFTGCYGNAKLYVSTSIGNGNGKYASRDFGLDLAPKILFAKSDLLSILVKSRVHQYLEFQSLSNFHTFENDNFEKLTNTKQEIFTDQKLPLMTKRNLMKFIKFVLNWDAQPEIWQAYADRSIYELMVEKFNLQKPQVFELMFSIGLCYNMETKTPEALQRIRRYLSSFDVYGPFSVLYSKYGGPGELSQGFCRSAAVGGATYKLNETLTSYDPTSKRAVFGDGSQVLVTEKVIVSPTQSPKYHKNVPRQQYEVHRLTCIVEKSCEQWFSEGESAAVVVFPPGSLKSGNNQVVQAFILGSGSEICPRGTSVWYLSTTQQGARAEMDLDAALEAMESSILRESSADLEQDESLVQFGPNGQTLINSVRLGQSFKEYVPREKIQFLFKLYYTQYTSTPAFNVVEPSLFDMNDSISGGKLIPGASDNGVLYTAMPSGEISYDEVVTAVKVLYEKIVGSDDDFFDLDFEDEVEAPLGKADYENAIDDDDDVDMSMGRHETPEFVGEMEI